MKAVFRAAIAALAFVAAIGAQAQVAGRAVTKEELLVLRLKLKNLYSDDQWMQEFVSTKMPMFSGESADRMKRHVQGLLTDDRLLDKLAELAGPAIEAGYTNKQFEAYFIESGMGLALKGLRRLDDGDLFFYAKLVEELLAFLPTDVCKAVLNNELSAKKIQVAEQIWMSRLPIDKLDVVLAFYRRAVLAEVQGYPSSRTLTADQAELGTQALQRAALERWSRMADPTAGPRSFANTKDADPSELCLSGLEFVRAYGDLKEPVRSWALLGFAIASGR